MAIALRYAARSDVGLLRSINEDSGYAGPRLLVIADGVGGHAAGEVASSVAVAQLAMLDEDSPGGDLLEQLSKAVNGANDHLRHMVNGDPDLKGMGTTLTALLRAGSRFGMVHVGDSRAYLLRGEDLQQITHDHTFVQTLVDEGRITPEEADHHPQRNLITNSLDGREDIELDLSVRETRPGDRYLLCSDGLSGVVSEETLRETLLSEADTDVAVDRLIDLALKGGGPDNITAIVADVVEVETKPPSAVPVTVGAAAEGITSRPSKQDTPAAKAAALRQDADHDGDDEDDEDDEQPSRSGLRRLLLVALVVALLGLGGYGAYGWSQTQYYVGAEGEEVAIFRGLSQDIGPLSTSRLLSAEDVALDDLPPYQRERVLAAIPAAGLSDARRVVRRLRTQAERCIAEREAATASPSPTATASPSPSPGDASPSPQASASPSPTQTATSAPRGGAATSCGVTR